MAHSALREARAARAEADLLAEKFGQDLRRALILWAVRWVATFLLIWFVTAASGGFRWLWWLGLAAAVASLVLTLAIKRRMSRRLERLDDRFDALERALAETPDAR